MCEAECDAFVADVTSSHGAVKDSATRKRELERIRKLVQARADLFTASAMHRSLTSCRAFGVGGQPGGAARVRDGPGG